MADETTAAPETSTSNFAAMSGPSPTAPDAVTAQLDERMAQAASAAEAEAGGYDDIDPVTAIGRSIQGLSLDDATARLDDVMAQAEIAANAERDLAAGGFD